MASPAAKHYAKAAGHNLPAEKKPAAPSSDVTAEEAGVSEQRRAGSPAQRHFVSQQAKVEASKAAETGIDMAHANQYELMLMQLIEHKRRLKAIQSIESKIELKKELVGEYDAYIDGVIASGARVQDDVIVTLLLWNIDAGNFSRALTIAEYVLASGMQTSEQHRRDAATIVAEEIADNAAKKDGLPVSLDDLVGAESLTADHDMPDEVRAKLHKALGTKLHEEGLLDSALLHLNRALQLHDKCGVKKLIEQIEREKKQAEKDAAGN
jgi:hypothetical protein